MLRYLLKTLLQMNLFTDTIRNPSNGTDLFFNISLPSFNSSLLDWGNFTGFNGKRIFFCACLSSFNLPFDLSLPSLLDSLMQKSTLVFLEKDLRKLTMRVSFVMVMWS